jgi:uncharacterized protein (DUF952 family)
LTIYQILLTKAAVAWETVAMGRWYAFYLPEYGTIAFVLKMQPKLLPPPLLSQIDALSKIQIMSTILHITRRDRWQAAKNLGTYSSETLATEGFIHCSTLAQVIGSANRFFKQQTDLVILVIEIDRVTPEIRYEGDNPNNLFPHIYGELNIEAVTQTIDLETNPDGSFIMPKELIES